MLKKNQAAALSAVALSLILISSCNKLDNYFHNGPGHGHKGYVYTMSNQSGTNSILEYRQKTDGSLQYVGSTNSGGAGSDMGLGSQGSLVLNEQHTLLFAVNAGDHTISSFTVDGDGTIRLAHTVTSYGKIPVSITIYKSFLYVVNSGSDNIAGFWVGPGGAMTPIPGSVQPLSKAGSGPAEILFKPNGKVLVVTEKNTNRITTFTVNGQGLAAASKSYPSVGETPFGFVFARNEYAIVTDAVGGQVNKSAVASHSVNNNGKVTLVSWPVGVNQTAACWIALSKNDEFCYCTNTGSNNISLLKVSNQGKLELLDGQAATTEKTPTDICTSGDKSFLYNLNSGSGSITQYKILSGGVLQAIGHVTGLSAHAAGLVSF